MSIVAPYTGAWIEIGTSFATGVTVGVAPYTGAWIEILPRIGVEWYAKGRTLHGCVD